jgi:copper chaperone
MTRTIKVKGMSCQHCVNAVSKTLSAIEGIQGVTIDLAEGEVTFEEVRPVDDALIRERIEKAGYELG